MSLMGTDEILAPGDVAEEFKLPERTLAQWRYLNKGPAYLKVGRHVRYRRRDVEAWLTSHTVAPSGDAA